MADNEHDIIKSVEVLHNIGSLSPAQRRQERKKRQNLTRQNDQERKFTEDELNKSTDKNISSEINENEQDRHSIDYCA
jgi:hypothetical protein